MNIGTKFRIYPTPAQQQVLLRWIGCQRFIYNAKVQEDRYFRTFARKALSLAGTPAPVDQCYAQFITAETAFLREVPSQVLRNGAYRWKTGYQRFFKRLAKGRPALKRRHERQSVLLTSELFAVDLTGGFRLTVGTKKCPVGDIKIKAHRAIAKVPVSVSISVEAGRWFLSFTVEEERLEPSEVETAEHLKAFSHEELLQMTLGVDLGTHIPVATSAETDFEFSEIEAKRLEGAERHARRYQRIAARRQKGSNRRKKALAKVARAKQYQANVRRDFAHKTSRALVATAGVQLFAFEDLKITNMSRSAKGTAEQPGRNVVQKAGLNRSILASAWGQTKEFTKYKARRVGKLMVIVPPHFSSQECSACRYTDPGNRTTQSLFACLRCGHSENADTNAAKVVRRRAVEALLAGAIEFKKPRQCCFRKQPGLGRSSMPVGETISRTLRQQDAHVSLIRETPTTALSA